jgi:hypothetical protein
MASWLHRGSLSCSHIGADWETFTPLVSIEVKTNVPGILSETSLADHLGTE